MEPPGGQPPDRDKQLVLHQQNQPKLSSLRVTTTNEPTSASSQQQQQQQLQLQQHHRHQHMLQPQSSQQSTTPSLSSSSLNLSQPPIERLSRPMAFDKMESLVREMQDPENGVPVRQQKMFLTSIPYAFMGYDLIEWLMDHLSIEESEALNIANQLCFHGYFFPVNDTKSLVVKDDSSLYRFQTPYYWPWQHKAPDNVEYAIYLAKRSLRNKQRHGLEDYESDALASLNRNLKGKWEFISMQAEEQVRLAKERKKGDKIVGDSQERAYWRVHRPPPGQFTPLEPCPVPLRDRQGIKPKKKNVEDYQREVDYLQKSLGRTRMKMSQACESLVTYSETFAEFDFFLHPVLPSNPWVTEDLTFWQLNSAIVDIPTEKRVKRWAISIEELVSDPTGLGEFTTFLEKEYSHENIRFWLAVTKLKRSAQSQVAGRVNEIYEEFLKPGAPCEINIDSKTMDIVQKGLKNPSRFTYDAAAEHIYMLLLKKDCYPRFIRSEHYKNLLATGIQPSHKKRFFNFGNVGVRKTKNTTAAASSQPATQTQLIPYTGSSCGPGPSIASLARRRGSDRSLTGSAHELAVIGVKDVSSKVPHSHSQSNLSEIPYGRDIPKTVLAKLETTVESCSVCPWDSPEVPAKTLKVTESPTITTSTTVQVCPWDEDAKLPPTPTCPRKSSNASDKKVAVDKLMSTTVEISDVADRMRKTCGLRQNTVDSSEYSSSKRLMPNITEQRRSSMTITPRNTELKTENKVSPAPSPPPPPELDIDLVEEDASSEHKTPSPQQPENKPEKDECELMAKMKITGPGDGKTECKEIQTESIELATTTATTTSSSPTSDNREDKEIELDNEQALQQGTNQTEEKPLESLKNNNNTSSNSSNINAVDDIKDESCVQSTAEEEVVEDKEQDKDKDQETEEGGVDVGKSEPVDIEIKVVVEEEKDSGIAEEQQTTPLPPQPPEELSPTTEGYQESTQDFYEIGIGDVESTSISAGCVAPAPTPAPSLAPLATVETDVADDELDATYTADLDKADQPSTSRARSSNEESKKRKKKRGSEDKKSEEAGGNGAPKSAESDRNTVCPWEDEDGSTSDTTFVKTYATFGYL